MRDKWLAHYSQSTARVDTKMSWVGGAARVKHRIEERKVKNTSLKKREWIIGG